MHHRLCHSVTSTSRANGRGTLPNDNLIQNFEHLRGGLISIFKSPSSRPARLNHQLCASSLVRDLTPRAICGRIMTEIVKAEHPAPKQPTPENRQSAANPSRVMSVRQHPLRRPWQPASFAGTCWSATPFGPKRRPFPFPRVRANNAPQLPRNQSLRFRC